MAHVAKHSRPAGTPFSMARSTGPRLTPDRPAAVAAVAAESAAAASVAAESAAAESAAAESAASAASVAEPATPVQPDPPAVVVQPEPEAAVVHPDAGIDMLGVEAAERPARPVTNATWASTLRKTARALVWALPISAVVSGAATIGSLRAGGPTQYLTSDEPVRLVLWVAGVWLGLVAMLALTGLLAAARSRVSAFTGLVLGMLGSLVMMMFVVVPAGTPVFGLDARWIALGGGAVYSLGWLFLGWSLMRSRLFSRGDGLLLMLAGPLLGAGGVWLAPLHTLGALLALAAGIGIAWTSGRLMPAVSRATAVGKAAKKQRAAATAPAAVAVSS